MRRNKNDQFDNVKSGKQPDQKPLQGSIEFWKNDLQQKLLTTTTDTGNTEIVDIKQAEKETTREENY